MFFALFCMYVLCFVIFGVGNSRRQFDVETLKLVTVFPVYLMNSVQTNQSCD